MKTQTMPELPQGTIIENTGRQQWLDSRKGFIGASEVAALFGESNWASGYSLWCEKSGDEKEQAPGTIGMERGKRFEPILAQEVRESQGWQVWEWPQTDFVVHDDADYRLGCTPDCLLHDGVELALGDFKMAGEFQKSKWKIEPPGVYQMQLQAQMAVTGIHKAYLLPAFGLHCEVEPVEVPYHEGFQAEMDKRVKAFWRAVDDGEAPEVDGKSATFEALKFRHPSDDGTSTMLYDLDSTAAADYTDFTSQIKELKTKQDIAKAKIIAAIGDSTFCSTDAGLCFSYKHQDSIRIDNKKLRDQYPEIAEKCSKTSSFRVLRSIKKVPTEA